MTDFSVKKSKEKFPTRYCVVCEKEIPKPDPKLMFTTARQWRIKKYCCLKCVYKASRLNKPKPERKTESYFEKWKRGEIF